MKLCDKNGHFFGFLPHICFYVFEPFTNVYNLWLILFIHDFLDYATGLRFVLVSVILDILLGMTSPNWIGCRILRKYEKIKFARSEKQQ